MSSMTEKPFARFLFFVVAWKKPELRSPSLSHNKRLRCLQYASSALYAALSSSEILFIRLISLVVLVCATSSSSLFRSMRILLLDCLDLFHFEIALRTKLILSDIELFVAECHVDLIRSVASWLSFNLLS